ncbi:MAG: hypothetical protein ACYCVH_01230 [Ignavibacteriaceae bacterium]
MEQVEKRADNQQQQTKEIPSHNCKRNLRIISQTHSVNSFHNIVIAQTTKCTICGKIFEESDPDGIISY